MYKLEIIPPKFLMFMDFKLGNLFIFKLKTTLKKIFIKRKKVNVVIKKFVVKINKQIFKV